MRSALATLAAALLAITAPAPAAAGQAPQDARQAPQAARQAPGPPATARLPAAPLPLAHGTIAFRVRVDAAPDFTGHASVDSASFTGDSLAGVRGFLVLRTDAMKTGIGLRDHHMRNAMETARYPEIRFELLGVSPGATHGDTTDVTYSGRLTIHGVTRDDTIPGTVVLGPGTVDAAAGFQLDMRDYGIKPPTRFLGIVRVEPVVAITVRLSFGEPPAAP